VTDREEPTLPEHEKPTDPSPPPASSLPPVMAPPPATDLERWQDAGLRPLDAAPPLLIDPSRGSLHVNAAGEVVRGDFVPARDWMDWGKDTGPRLRVKAVDVAPVPERAPARPEDADPCDVREVHEAYKRAAAAGDDAAIAKIFPDVLDELHSKNPGAAPIPTLDWYELEPALAREWREWGQAHAVRGKAVAVRHNPHSNIAEALIPLDTGDPYLVTSDEKAVRTAWKKAKGDPRATATLLVRAATEELHKVRRGEVVAET